MKKVVKINEDTFNRLFNSTINEISHDTVDRAYNKSDDIFYNLTNAFNDFYENPFKIVNYYYLREFTNIPSIEDRKK